MYTPWHGWLILPPHLSPIGRWAWTPASLARMTIISVKSKENGRQRVARLIMQPFRCSQIVWRVLLSFAPIMYQPKLFFLLLNTTESAHSCCHDLLGVRFPAQRIQRQSSGPCSDMCGSSMANQDDTLSQCRHPTRNRLGKIFTLPSWNHDSSIQGVRAATPKRDSDAEPSMSKTSLGLSETDLLVDSLQTRPDQHGSSLGPEVRQTSETRSGDPSSGGQGVDSRQRSEDSRKQNYQIAIDMEQLILPPQIQALLNDQRNIAELIEQAAGDSSFNNSSYERFSNLANRVRSNADIFESTTRQLVAGTLEPLDLEGTLPFEPLDFVHPDGSRRSHQFPILGQEFTSPRSQSSEYQSVVIHPTLQEYYTAAGWAGVLKERLVDLQYDHYEGLEKKRLDPTLSTLMESQSDVDFRQAEIEMKEELNEAERRAELLLQRCKDQGLSVQERPPSSILPPASMPSDSMSPRYLPVAHDDPRASSQSSDIRRALSSVGRRRSTKNFEKPQQHPFAKAGSFISQWIQDVYRHNYGTSDATPEHATLTHRISMESVTSLPEYVLVDKHPWDLQRGSAGANIRELDSSQVQHRNRLPARRHFVYTGMSRSNPALGEAPDSTPAVAFRRHTLEGSLTLPPAK